MTVKLLPKDEESQNLIRFCLMETTLPFWFLVAHLIQNDSLLPHMCDAIHLVSVTLIIFFFVLSLLWQIIYAMNCTAYLHVFGYRSGVCLFRKPITAMLGHNTLTQ
ncbi:Period circadian protein-like protein 2 [Bienertia sinuspersici]